MACDCRKVIEAALVETHMLRSPEAVIKSATISGYGLNFTKGGESQAAPYEVEAEVPLRKGGVRRKVIKGHMVFAFRPFCGVAR